MKKMIISRTLISIALIGFFLIGSSCNDDDDGIVYESTAMLIMPDFALCPCCGGWIVEIENDSSRYRIETFPEDFELIWEEEDFPKAIDLNWTLNRDCAGTLFLDVDDIRYQ